MAESVVILEDQVHNSPKFFCHMCAAEIENVSAEYTCPICSSGFIEELQADRTAEANPDVEMHDDPQFNMNSRLTDEIQSILMSVTGGQQLFVMDDNNDSAQPSQDANSRRRRRFSVHSLHDFDSIVQDFIVSLTGGAGQPMYIMGNPGDYVYSRDSLDTIVTQLLNQMDGTGPPPLTKDKIAEIPKVAVTEDQVNSKLQCSICWEDFQLTETVRRLPCVHIYHENCIVPWLELHGTCPVCRKTLNDNPEEQPHVDISNSFRTVAAMYRNEMGASSSSASNSSFNTPNSSRPLAATTVRRTRSLTRRQQPPATPSPTQQTNDRMRDDDGNIDYEFD
ncbi:E3 ubiquitin-protein ligase Iruka [Pseudolycoriella hygida]|uniref:RING-type E3 ubiquitin transferase n=1 Tax=Pseudolycoriella hygida TaxID=35572 RepID=A0A9Q0RVB9_9DIPT|nr:E3 ubiquitin-protein ligase Iruka [Pseudolycoriella hygida]